MRIATIMSIAVLGLSGAAIAQVATSSDQDTPPPMQDNSADTMTNNMVTPTDPMANDMMDHDSDDMDSAMPDTMPDAAPDSLDPTMPPESAPVPDSDTTI
ncbi:hypothetical protein ACFO8O_06005 [Hephaestia sp. GCM10023244]|uniref:hypothetical protein n=1 Tax=unclassified Hephaestia TaxID=2631281 RepID=UPI0020776FE7|nr:hypothetical protein [Hephaestia sp. MAHUQ-44]MCM8730521.1 hypothetical protein [Hephaestia sp. MAHUQ-44]